MIARNGSKLMGIFKDVAPDLRSSTRAAIEVPLWAVAFYRRHLRLVGGLSAVAAVERFVVVLWGALLPSAVMPVLEFVVLGARVLLFVVSFRLAISDDERLGKLGGDEGWQRMMAFTRARWSDLVCHLLFITGAFITFDVIPERVVTRWIPDDLEATYFAILLAVKNFTVIPFTIIWLVGVLRQMLLDSPPGATPASANSVR